MNAHTHTHTHTQTHTNTHKHTQTHTNAHNSSTQGPTSPSVKEKSQSLAPCLVGQSIPVKVHCSCRLKTQTVSIHLESDATYPQLMKTLWQFCQCPNKDRHNHIEIRYVPENHPNSRLYNAPDEGDLSCLTIMFSQKGRVETPPNSPQKVLQGSL
jgi:hypothetical protein